VKIAMTKWTWVGADSLTWRDYAIMPASTPFGIRWEIWRGDRPASALLFKRLRDAARLAEWDAAVRAQSVLPGEMERGQRRPGDTDIWFRRTSSST